MITTTKKDENKTTPKKDTTDKTDETVVSPESESNPNGELALGVTLEPQSEDQADLRLVGNGVAVSRVSVPVDDDEGQWINDPEIFEVIKAFIKENESKKGDALKDSDLLENGTELAARFNEKICLNEAISLGLINKYRILYGRVLNILKDSYKASNPKGSWMIYYSEKFQAGTLSSAEKYMKLARIPHVIRWAFLGLERLESIYTVIKGTDYMDKDEPIDEFMRDINVEIRFQDENLEGFRTDIDAAVTVIKIKLHFDKKNAELSSDKRVDNNVDPSLIHELVSIGGKCDSNLINNLYLFAKGLADPNVLLTELLQNGGRKPSDASKGKLTDIKTIEGFPRIISELKSKVKYLTDHEELVKEIDPVHVADLEAQITALKELVNSQNDDR